jgi:hypothetical protein
MTLKEKFNAISCASCDIEFCDSKCLIFSESELSKMEEIAEEFAIGFAEWLRGYRYDNAEIYHISSTKELLEIYKKEKGL